MIMATILCFIFLNSRFFREIRPWSYHNNGVLNEITSTISWYYLNIQKTKMGEEPYERQHRLQRQKSGCKNPFVPFKHGVKDDMTNFEPLQTLQEKDPE